VERAGDEPEAEPFAEPDDGAEGEERTRAAEAAKDGVVEPPVDSEPVVPAGPDDAEAGAGADTAAGLGDNAAAAGADGSDSVEDPADQPAE